MRNVLISSAGRRVELIGLASAALSRRMKGGSVLAGDCDRRAPGLYRADRGLLLPRVDAPEYIKTIMQLCASEEIALIVPTIDTELRVYAEARDGLSTAGTRVVISDASTVDITSDKGRFHEHLQSHRIPTVRQIQADGVGRVLDQIGLPCIVKPVVGRSSIGQSLITTRRELHAAVRPAAIAQSIAPGDEYTVDVLVEGGRCLTTVPRRRIAVRAGEVAKAVTERVDDVTSLAERVVTSLPGAQGPICVQIFKDPGTGELNVIEVNARFGGGFPLAAAAGADFMDYLIAEMTGTELPSLDWRPGVMMLRYDQSVFVSIDELLS